ncbi:adenylate kinase [soil metagenome]
MRLVLIGAPGSGKGTQAELLVKRLGLTYVGTGEMLRAAIAAGTPTGLQVKPLMEQGLLVPDVTVNDVVADLLRRKDRPEAFVMDGYPRTYAQAIAFDALLNQLYLKLDGVVSFAISDDEVVRRINSRRAKSTKVRDDDNETTVRRRLEEFHKNTDNLIEHYRRAGLLREIDATQPVELIYSDVLKSLRKTT